MKLTAELRDPAISLESLRSSGMIPGVCYNKAEGSTSLVVKASSIDSLIRQGLTTSIITLEGLGEDKDVLFKDIQRDPVSERVLHFDFYVITKGEEIEAEVPVEFVGEAPVEKAGGVLVKVMRDIVVKCMPKDLPTHIEVDVTSLAAIGESLQVKDVPFPEGVTPMVDEDEAIASTAATQELVEDEVPTAIDMDAIESEQKGKKDEEGDESAE